MISDALVALLFGLSLIVGPHKPVEKPKPAPSLDTSPSISVESSFPWNPDGTRKLTAREIIGDSGTRDVKSALPRAPMKDEP